MPAKKLNPPRRKKGESVLTEKKLRFVREYLKDGNGTQAAIRAGYSAGKNNISAAVMAATLLKDAKVRALLVSKTEEAEFTAELAVRELGRIALADPRKLFHPDGTPRDITQLDDATAAALGGIEVSEQFEGSGKDRKFVGMTKKYKLFDKNAALGNALRMFGKFVDKIEHTGADGQPLIPQEDAQTLAKKVAFILMRGATNPKEAA